MYHLYTVLISRKLTVQCAKYLSETFLTQGHKMYGSYLLRKVGLAKSKTWIKNASKILSERVET